MDVLDALCDGKAKDENDLIRHNTIVFNGEKALQVLPGLVDYVPEARLNLAISYIKQGEIDAAVELIGDMDADSPQSHFVIGILNAKRAQTREDAKAFTTACNHFQSMGEASTERDTVAGRQCSAMHFYLMKQFEDANVFLESIKEHSEDADDFNWNTEYPLLQVASLKRYALHDIANVLTKWSLILFFMDNRGLKLSSECRKRRTHQSWNMWLGL